MTLLFSHDAIALHWQLGPPPDAKGVMTLIGWTDDDGDGGIPRSVVRALSSGFAAFGTALFFSSLVKAAGPERQARSGDKIARPPGPPGLRGLARHFAGREVGGLVATSKSDTFATLFDDAKYPWWYQRQCVLLLRAGTRLPDIAVLASHLSTLLEPAWAGCLPSLAPFGVESLFRPGVDGDVAGLFCVSAEIRQQIEGQLSAAALAQGIGCKYLGESGFAAALGQ